ncbi:MAG: shikimate dehydrogenase [Patescibacteria group bacterium]|nr:shikimate dehydrogenase [Patescibacteria group bacterium]
MKIDTQTKLIGRFHTQDNGTGLNIYNPYFEDQGINAVYMLFRSDKPQELIDGMRGLHLTGAITAGFEHDPSLAALVDELDETVEISGIIGNIANSDGKIRAHYQGGYGFLNAIQEKIDTTDKRLVIVGASTVVKTLLLALEKTSQKPNEVIIVNRTLDHAKALQKRFNWIKSVHSLVDLESIKGDILVNATRIGSVDEDTVYTNDIVSSYQAVADVTFGNPVTNLTTLGQDNGLVVINGWDMFTHQAAVLLKHVLGHSANIDRLRYFVSEGLASNNHAPILEKR